MGIGSERSAQRSLSFWWPYSAVSMSTTCHAGQTAYHPRSPTNEKIGLVCMPDQLHTIHCHRPMRRLGLLYNMPCRTNCIPSTFTDQWEDWAFCVYACRTNFIPSTFTDQWEDKTCTSGTCHTGPAAINAPLTTNEKAAPSQLHVDIDQWEECSHN